MPQKTNTSHDTRLFHTKHHDASQNSSLDHLCPSICISQQKRSFISLRFPFPRLTAALWTTTEYCFQHPDSSPEDSQLFILPAPSIIQLFFCHRWFASCGLQNEFSPELKPFHHRWPLGLEWTDIMILIHWRNSKPLHKGSLAKTLPRLPSSRCEESHVQKPQSIITSLLVALNSQFFNDVFFEVTTFYSFLMFHTFSGDVGGECG